MPNDTYLFDRSGATGKLAAKNVMPLIHTKNTGASDADKWTAIARVTFTSTGKGVCLPCKIHEYDSANTSPTLIDVEFRVKQNAALGTSAAMSASVGFAARMTADDVLVNEISKAAGSNVYLLMVKVKSANMSYYVEMQEIMDSTGVTVEYLENQDYYTDVAAIALGTGTYQQGNPRNFYGINLTGWTLTLPTGSNQSIAAGGTIDASTYSNIRVQGNGAARTCGAPSITVTSMTNGRIVMLQGLDDTNTLTVPTNASVTGSKMVLNTAGGNCVLGKGDTMILAYNSTLDRWVEYARSANTYA
jgi:hypothetical protein